MTELTPSQLKESAIKEMEMNEAKIRDLRKRNNWLSKMVKMAEAGIEIEKDTSADTLKAVTENLK